MVNDTERWLPVPGYEGLYEVSNHGRVRSLTRKVTVRTGYTRTFHGRILSTGSRRYPTVTLSQKDVDDHRRVHQLVMEAFVGPCPPGMRVLHWDDNPTNNVLSNLRYGTQRDNIHDCLRNGNNRNASKSECRNGHKFTPENTRVVRKADGRQQRFCRECHRISNRAYEARVKRPTSSRRDRKAA